MRPRLLAFAVAAVAAAVTAPTAGAMRPLKLSNLLLPARPFRDTILRAPPARSARRLYNVEGTYDAPDGTPVHIVFEGRDAVDDAAGQSTATFLGSLMHGPELARLTANLGSFAATQAVCGVNALACYSVTEQALYVPTSVPPNVGIPVEQILAHEYGHHVAANRSNPPWDALAWGPKRWATYMRVCPRTQRGEMFPGDEGAAYELNPGEGWAESYRVANARLAGWADIGWPIVDDLFRPDATGLALVQADATTPWAPSPPKTVAGTVRRTAATLVRIATPLDGSLSATLTGPSGSTVGFLTPARKPTGSRGIRASATVCGSRTLYLSVRSARAGAFRIAYSTP